MPSEPFTRIKICGITTLHDARIAAGAGADMLGFNFYPPSPRYLPPEACRTITDALREEMGDRCPLLVGVFVNEPDAQTILKQAGLDAAQLHGDEPPSALAAFGDRAFKAIRPRDRNEAWQKATAFTTRHDNANLPTLLVDAYHRALYGGTGKQTATAVALAAKEQTPRLLLAGGLTPDNVGDYIHDIRPWGVDVAGGVEGDIKGQKDEACIRAFIAAVKIADARP